MAKYIREVLGSLPKYLTTNHDSHTPHCNVGYYYHHYQSRAKAMHDIELVYNRERLRRITICRQWTMKCR